MSGLLSGKRGLVMGVANDRSLAWGIARAMAEAGAELAFTYQGEAFGKRLEPLAAQVGSDFMVDVDVTDDDSLDTAFDALAARWPTLDFLVHAIAYSDKSELTGRFLNTSRANFKHSMDVSAYSFIEVARRAHPMMLENGGCLMTPTSLGCNRLVPYNNTLGVPKATLASSTPPSATCLRSHAHPVPSSTPRPAYQPTPMPSHRSPTPATTTPSHYSRHH